MNELLVSQCQEILKESDKLAAICNAVAFLYDQTENINWLGIYIHKNKELVLGPFQGKIACTHLKIGHGVCGTSFERKLLLNVEDVHKFPGHIACDAASNSELVVPLLYQNKCLGVLDIDSPLYSRFTLDDEITFEAIAHQIAERLI